MVGGQTSQLNWEIWGYTSYLLIHNKKNTQGRISWPYKKNQIKGEEIVRRNCEYSPLDIVEGEGNVRHHVRCPKSAARVPMQNYDVRIELAIHIHTPEPT